MDHAEASRCCIGATRLLGVALLGEAAASPRRPPATVYDVAPLQHPPLTPRARQDVRRSLAVSRRLDIGLEASGLQTHRHVALPLPNSAPQSQPSGLPRADSKRLRVALVAPSLRILGGQAVQADRLLRAWRDDPDVEAWLVPINPAPPGPLVHLTRLKYARTIVTQVVYWPLLLRELWRADVVHAFSASYFSFLLAPLPALVVARLLGKPILINYRSGEAPDHLRRSPIARVALARTDTNVVPSRFLRDVFAGFGLPAEIIPNVVDLTRFAFAPRRPLRPRLLSTRNFEPLYNVGGTLRAFSTVQARYADASLTLVGAGSEEPRLRAMASELGLRNVTFAGRIPPAEIWRSYADADIYVQTPNIDNMPSSVLEAFASGLPVVSTDAGGVPAILTDGVHGLLAPVGDHDAVARQVLRLLRDQALADRLTEAALASCAAYRWEVVRGQWLSLYRRLAERQPIPTAREVFFSSAPLDAEASEARERAFFHSIRLKNGTYKTTYSHRLDIVNEIVNKVLPPHRPLEILDVGVSSGLSTLEWMENLERAGIEYRMTAGDLCVKTFLLSFGRVLNALVDKTGYPLQFDVLGRAIPYPLGRCRAIRFPPLFVLAQALRWALPGLFAALFKNWAIQMEGDSVRRFGVGCRRVRMLSQRLKNVASLSIVEDDILAPGPFTKRFHILRAANVLNKEYFSDETLIRIVVNLRARLKQQGILVVCRTDEHHVNHGTVFRLNRADGFDVVCRIGDGSEIENLILRLPGVRRSVAHRGAHGFDGARGSRNYETPNGRVPRLPR
jgi:glycosyltransferase involved in cell wall biosynthesis